MRISNCKGCGRIFNVLSDEQYCPNCQKKMDEKFDIVKRFVEDNPNVPVETVAKEKGFIDIVIVHLSNLLLKKCI